jgi:phosphoribosyl-ATP pyrophosphohydrolase/phosphoribosyl-AMP cyclohydrolase
MYKYDIMEKINFKKNADGLVPAIIQDSITLKVLMLGYMNQEAVAKTLETKKVTFYSRTRKRLWTKGEESGNYLNLVAIHTDCDQDTLLLTVIPEGPVCHTGSDTCWDEENTPEATFLSRLEEIIEQRKISLDDERSYVASLFRKGINAIAQKVGEEAVETIIEAKDNNDELFLNEGADLLFHFLILLNAKGYRLKDIETLLEGRHVSTTGSNR